MADNFPQKVVQVPAAIAKFRIVIDWTAAGFVGEDGSVPPETDQYDARYSVVLVDSAGRPLPSNEQPSGNLLRHLTNQEKVQAQQFLDTIRTRAQTLITG